MQVNVCSNLNLGRNYNRFKENQELETDYSVEYVRPSTGRMIGGISAGLGTSLLTNLLAGIGVCLFAFSAVVNKGRLPEEKRPEIIKKIISLFEKPEYKKTGVKICPLPSDALSGSRLESFISDKTKSEISFYLPKENTVYYGKEYLIKIFNDLGSAVNARSGIFDKILKAGSITSLCLFPVIFWVGLLKNKKAPEEETKGNFDKTTDFIKNNAGKLVFLGFIPTLIKILRDGLKGKHIIKQCAPELVKQYNKSNHGLFLSILMVGLNASLGTYLGIKVKDSIAKREAVVNEVTEAEG